MTLLCGSWAVTSVGQLLLFIIEQLTPIFSLLQSVKILSTPFKFLINPLTLKIDRLSLLVGGSRAAGSPPFSAHIYI